MPRLRHVIHAYTHFIVRAHLVVQLVRCVIHTYMYMYLGERERAHLAIQLGQFFDIHIVYSVSQDTVMFLRTSFSLSHLDISRVPRTHILTHQTTDERTTQARLQQLTLYQQQLLASGSTDGRAVCLQHSQPAAVPSVGNDRRRERLDFSVAEIVTEISEQLILPLSMGHPNFAVSYI